MQALTRAALAAIAPLVLLSCGKMEKGEQVTDLGFEVSAEVSFSAEHLRSVLSLGLSEGTDGEYSFSYTVDSDRTMRLTTERGANVEPGGKMELSRAGRQILLLPKMTGEGHVVRMEFTREGVTRTCSAVFSSETAVSVRMDTDESLDFTRVILTNRHGNTVTSYSAAFLLDGERLSGIKHLGKEFGGETELDFARSESCTFELPYIVAGDHDLRVEIRSELGSETTTVPFTEPERRATRLVFSYSGTGGELTLSSDHNPLDTEFEVTADITVTGSVTYRHELFFGVADPKTERFTESGQHRCRLRPGLSSASADGGLLKTLMDRVYSNARTDASNAIGNGNRRTLHSDITGVTIALTVTSGGATAGKTAVDIAPASGAGLPVRYLYREPTWSRGANSTQTITPTLTVNGRTPGSVHKL